MSKCIIHTNAGLTSVTQVLSREKIIISAAVMETVVTPAVIQPQTVTAADGSVTTEDVVISPEHSREQETTPAAYRDETEDEALARVVATMTGPTLILPLASLPAGGPETWTVDYATGIVSIRALTTEQLVAHVAAKRRGLIASGTTLTVGTATIPTWADSETQAALTALVVATTMTPTLTTTWRGRDGNFYPLDAAGIVALATGVMIFVQVAFGIEALAVAAVNAGTATTVAHVDGIFTAALTPTATSNS
ncbi:MAG: hypothetical protein ABL901_03030 [Hyphomicrobiaceae bacterium]|nr:DUF4376 domain-containing protein [Hyphomicrobiaceae bacterium]